MTTSKAVAGLIGILLGGCTAINPFFGDVATDGEAGEGGPTGGPASSSATAGTRSGSGGASQSSGGTVDESDTAHSTSGSQTSGTGTASDTSTPTSSGSSTTGEETRPFTPPCGPDGGGDEVPTLCYDFEEVMAGIVTDRSGNANLVMEAPSLIAAPAGWGQGLDCSVMGCSGTADGFDIGSAYTIEVWARLTELEAGDVFTANLVRLAARDSAGFDVRAGKSLELWLAATVQTTFRLISESRSMEYFCVALQWEDGESPTYSAYDSTGALVMEEGMPTSPTSVDLSSPTLVVGNGDQALPVQVIGLRVWDIYVPNPCDPPGVP